MVMEVLFLAGMSACLSDGDGSELMKVIPSAARSSERGSCW